MNTRDRHHRPALVQALEGIGLVVLVSAGVWAVGGLIALIVSLVF